MNKYIEVIAVVEGKTEQVFVESILAPYLGEKNIGIKATQLSKPGQKGGDVRFERAKKDLSLHLRQRKDTYITTFVDYYGIKEWPGLDKVCSELTPDKIAEVINLATKKEVIRSFDNQQARKRFIPFISVHEFEALLFSDIQILSEEIETDEEEIGALLKKFGDPESINNSPQTAPSKILDKWSKNGKFPKTTKGITIAGKIGIETMRKKCPIFNSWLQTFEDLQKQGGLVSGRQ